MENINISVREMREDDIASIVNYFHDASAEYLAGMGAIKALLPSKESWANSIKADLQKENKDKALYYLIWELDGKAIGHTNENNIAFGNEAYMHLHIWAKDVRKKRLGAKFIRKSLSFYFKNFELKTLLVEPYAKNPAPTNTILASGFTFERERETIPSIVCEMQIVKRYTLSRDAWKKMSI